MDVKALAKSNRAHAQRHSKKHHPNQKANAPAVDGGKASDAGPANKPLGKQVKEKTNPTHGASALPTNWDRYEEEFEAGSEEPAGDGLNRAPDVAVPMSKGADYRHLIAEAKAQSELTIYSDPFPSLDNVLLGDWNEGIGSMLSVRGESILSRIGDDNFVVEDKTAAHHEVSFLSLNLHALAEQLEKIALPERLFIEAELLPPELHVEGQEVTCSQSSDPMQATCNEEATRGMPEESISEKVQVADHDIEITISGSTGSGHPDPILPNLGSVSVIQGNINPSKLGKSDYQSKLSESETQFSVKSFEASTAEAELDMLLDSFGETKINDSSGFSSVKTVSVQEAAFMAPLQLPRKAPDSSVLATANFGDELDDLINETSVQIRQSGPSQAQKERAVHEFRSSHSGGTKSEEQDDFDSWLDTI